FHHNRCSNTGHHRVLQGTDFKDGLPGTDDFRKAPLLPLAIYMHDFDRFSNYAYKRMQDDKTRTVGEEVAQRNAIGRKYQQTIPLGFNLCLILEGLIRIATGSVITN